MGDPFGKTNMKWVVVVRDSGRNDNQQSLRGKAGADNSQPDRQTEACSRGARWWESSGCRSHEAGELD